MNDHELINSRVANIINARREISINQARWVLMPLFGLWIMFSLAGVFFG